MYKGAHIQYAQQSHGEFRGSPTPSLPPIRLDSLYSIAGRLARSRHYLFTDRMLVEQTGYDLL